MGPNKSAARQSHRPARVSWNHKDAILCALGIGAGHEDPLLLDRGPITRGQSRSAQSRQRSEP